MTSRSWNRDSSVMMSSVKPSEKNSWSGSPLMFTNGSTAIEGTRVGVGFGCAAPEAAAAPVSLPSKQHAENANRPADVLDGVFAEILEADVEPVADLFAHCGGDADAAGLRDRLETRGDIHAVAEDVVVLDDHVAEIDADAIQQATVRAFVTLRHRTLKVSRATDCLGDALEFHQHSVAGGLDDAALAFRDGRVDQFLAHGPEARERARLRRLP